MFWHGSLLKIGGAWKLHRGSLDCCKVRVGTLGGALKMIRLSRCHMFGWVNRKPDRPTSVRNGAGYVIEFTAHERADTLMVFPASLTDEETVAKY